MTSPEKSTKSKEEMEAAREMGAAAKRALAEEEREERERKRDEAEERKREEEQEKKDKEKQLVRILLEINDHTYYRIGNKHKDQTLRLTPMGVLSLKKNGEKNDTSVYPGEVLKKSIGDERLFELIQDGDITLESLDILPNTNYRITNRTAVRVHMANYGKGRYGEKSWGDLVIPPFGTRTVNSEILKWYKFLEWQRQDLIKLELEDDVAKGPGFKDTLQTWLKLLPGFVFVLLVGFGIPLWVVANFGGGGSLLTSFFDGQMFVQGNEKMALMGLGRMFQVVFICLASILPALFYYLFGRQHVEKLRQRFFRDILVLDPHLYTLSEAETKYDTLLSSAYGSSSSSSPLAILLLMFSTIILVVGWIVTIAPYGSTASSATSLVGFFQIEVSPFTLGFLGIYFFAVNMVFRRYVRADLTPKTYANITVRMLITFVLVWTVDALQKTLYPTPSSAPLLVQSGFLAFAFTIGVFPENGFRIIRDWAQNFTESIKTNKTNNDNKDNDEKYPLTDLEGLNKYDQARLLEEGIENIENLAHHNLVELLAYTRIPSERLIDMFDQAILYLHLGLFDNDDEELLKNLKALGVRTATDLIKMIEFQETSPIPEVILSAEKLSRLRVIYETFSDDGWLSFIKNWRGSFSTQQMKVSYVEDPNLFYLTGWSEANSETES